MLTIETQRLLLRPYTDADRDDFLKLVSDAEVMRRIEGGVVNREVAGDWWQRLLNNLFPSGIRWCTRTVVDSQYVGHAMINYTRPAGACELCYILPKSVWGNGYATEIAKALADYSSYQLEQKEVFGTVDEDHTASIKVLKKAGMNFYGYDFDEDGRYLVYLLQHNDIRK